MALFGSLLAAVGLCGVLLYTTHRRVVAVAEVRPLSMFLVPEVRPADPANFVLVACALAVVAGLATVAPTVRALRVDPAVALRDE